MPVWEVAKKCLDKGHCSPQISGKFTRKILETCELFFSKGRCSHWIEKLLCWAGLESSCVC